jgi:hypothetical protein
MIDRTSNKYIGQWIYRYTFYIVVNTILLFTLNELSSTIMTMRTSLESSDKNKSLHVRDYRFEI